VHHLQGKAESVTPTELQHLLREFYLDRLALLMQHEAGARVVPDYDVNNAYQYIISREETQVSWLQHALLDLGGQIPPDPPLPTVAAPGKGATAWHQIPAADARDNMRFVDKWRDRVGEVTNARHQGMLRVVLGEMLEHRRIFEQSAEGRTDIIGKAMPMHERRGTVLETRWVE
jgi:hypothetical protein